MISVLFRSELGESFSGVKALMHNMKILCLVSVQERIKTYVFLAELLVWVEMISQVWGRKFVKGQNKSKEISRRSCSLPAKSRSCRLLIGTIENRIVGLVQENALRLSHKHPVVFFTLKLSVKWQVGSRIFKLTVKYAVPLIVPLFFPFASSKTTPTHRPAEQEENIFTWASVKGDDSLTCKRC